MRSIAQLAPTGERATGSQRSSVPRPTYALSEVGTTANVEAMRNTGKLITLL